MSRYSAGTCKNRGGTAGVSNQGESEREMNEEDGREEQPRVYSRVCACDRNRLHKRREKQQNKKERDSQTVINQKIQTAFYNRHAGKGPNTGSHSRTHRSRMIQRGGVSLPEAHGLSTEQRQQTPDGSRPLRPDPRNLEAAAEQGASAGSTRTSHVAEATNPQALQRPMV